jgi:hypothetical protein
MLQRFLVHKRERLQYTAAIHIIQLAGAGALRVRHHTKHIAALIAYTRNIVEGAIRV